MMRWLDAAQEDLEGTVSLLKGCGFKKEYDKQAEKFLRNEYPKLKSQLEELSRGAPADQTTKEGIKAEKNRQKKTQRNQEAIACFFARLVFKDIEFHCNRHRFADESIQASWQTFAVLRRCASDKRLLAIYQSVTQSFVEANPWLESGYSLSVVSELVRGRSFDALQVTVKLHYCQVQSVSRRIVNNKVEETENWSSWESSTVPASLKELLTLNLYNSATLKDCYVHLKGKQRSQMNL